MIDIKTPEEQILERMAAVEEVVIDLTKKIKALESFILRMDERINTTEITKAKNGAAIRNLETSVKILYKKIDKEI